MTALAALVLAATTAAGGRTDTSFAVPTGSQLSVESFSGPIAVRAWEKPMVRIQADHGERVKILVSQRGTSFKVRARDTYRGPRNVAYIITAPPWMSLDLEGVQCDMEVTDWKSDVLAETVHGDVKVTGGEGLIRLSSISGAVKVVGARGRVKLSSVGQAVDVKDATGEISVEAVNGNVSLDRIHGKLVEAESVNGNVSYGGWFDPGAHYRFSSHSGDLEVMLPPDPDATISVSTFNGGFESQIPVKLGEAKPGREFTFTLGQGRALVDLESFTGTIRLKRREAGGRPAETPEPSGH